MAQQTFLAAQSPVEVQFPPIAGIAQPGLQVGYWQLNAQQLHNIPNQTEDLTTLLQLHPHIQFSDTAQSAAQAGEISPKNISINGSLPYSNSILLNGVETSNRIVGMNAGSALISPTLVGSHALLSSIPVQHLCEVTVLDSNIDAAYGDFSGGVVSAKSCAPQTAIGTLHGSLHTDYTHHGWVSSPTLGNSIEGTTLTNADYPKFRTYGLSTDLFSQVTSDLGLNLQYAERESSIETQPHVNGQQSQQERRRNQRFALNSFFKINASTELKSQLSHTHQDSLHFIANYKNDGIQTQNVTTTWSNVLQQQLDHGQQAHTLTLQRHTLQRHASTQDFIPWRWSPEKSWGNGSISNEGSLGDLSYQQQIAQYQATWSMLPWQWPWFEQQFNSGWGLKYQRTTWQRPHDNHVYFLPRLSITSLDSCENLQGELDPLCDLSFVSRGVVGQFHQQRYLHQAARITEAQWQAHGFVSNALQWSPQLHSTLGLRVDYDHLGENLNVAPRLHIQWQPFAHSDTRLSFGLNRYYESSLFEHYLQYQTHALSQMQMRQNINSPWLRMGQGNLLPIQPQQLKNPYSDEFSVGITQSLQDIHWGLKWVQRHYRDQIQLLSISEDADQADQYVYRNLGRSDADVWSLTLGHLAPLQFWGAQHDVQLGADYTAVARNFEHYNDILYSNSQYMLYRDRVIAAHERPASNYNQPWTVRVNWEMQLHSIPLTVNHVLRYRSPNKVRFVTQLPLEAQFEHRGSWVYEHVYEERSGSRLNWDIQTQYPLWRHQDSTLHAGLNIFNVTNRKNRYFDLDNHQLSPEMGRQFVLHLNFDF